MKDISNPFKENKVNWAKKAENKYARDSTVSKAQSSSVNKKVKSSGFTGKPKVKSPKIKRVAKSFKVYGGDIVRKFDRRVSLLEMDFSDLGFDKNFVDSGQYIMFLMSFAEKYGLYDLYSKVDGKGNFEIDSKKLEVFKRRFSLL